MITYYVSQSAFKPAACLKQKRNSRFRMLFFFVLRAIAWRNYAVFLKTKSAANAGLNGQRPDPLLLLK